MPTVPNRANPPRLTGRLRHYNRRAARDRSIGLAAAKTLEIQEFSAARM